MRLTIVDEMIPYTEETLYGNCSLQWTSLNWQSNDARTKTIYSKDRRQKTQEHATAWGI